MSDTVTYWQVLQYVVESEGKNETQLALLSYDLRTAQHDLTTLA